MMYHRSISISLLLGLFYVNAFAVTTDIYKFEKEYQSTLGVVTFDHEAHAMGRVKDCEFCHSALKTFGGQVNESRNGPTECGGCHRR